MGSIAGSYVDTCLLVSLFLQDEGYPAAERWLAGSAGNALWISHWVLLEFAGAVGLRLRRGDLDPRRAEAIHGELEEFRRDRLALLEPTGEDFLMARGWLLGDPSSGLRSGDALHLALASRSALPLVSADQRLVQAAGQLGIPARLVI
jgi:uncharacterized protein